MRAKGERRGGVTFHKAAPNPGLRFASAFSPHRFAGGGIRSVEHGQTQMCVHDSKSGAGVGKLCRRSGILIEQPSRARGGVHRIRQANRQPFGARPRNHRTVVGAQRRRRDNQRDLRAGSDILQRGSDRPVGGDAAGGNQRAGRAELFME